VCECMSVYERTSVCACVALRACAYMRAIVCEVSDEELGHCKPCISLMPCSACCLQPFNM